MTATSASFREKPIPDFTPDTGRVTRLGEWFAAEYKPLLRFAYFVSGDPDTANDLVHDAFVRMYRAGGRPERDGVGSYARRTIANLARTRFRRGSVERRHLHLVARPETAPAAGTDVETRDEVWTAIMTLSPQQRAVVALRFYEHMDQQQIAEVLGVSVGTVKKQMSRALQRCRAELGGSR